jgi:hypothetical protein
MEPDRRNLLAGLSQGSDLAEIAAALDKLRPLPFNNLVPSLPICTATRASESD